MFEEDIYFWTKNCRPDTHKNQDLNSVCHYKLRHLKTEGVLLKTYHLDFGEGQCGKRVHKDLDQTVFHQDIAPYVPYSVNKRKRWEIEAGVELLGEIQKMYDGMEVSVLERVMSLISPYVAQISFHNYYFSKFPILRIHNLQDDNSYEITTVNSVHGQPIKHFSFENRSSTKSTPSIVSPKVASRPKVAYHLISPSKNYETLLHKRFHPGRKRMKWWWPLEYLKVDWKKFIEEDLYEWITYDGLMDREWDDIHEWDEEEEEDDGRDHPKEYYNLDEHVVENWIFIKKRKTRKREFC